MSATFVYELLDGHFDGLGIDALSTVSRTFPARVRVDIQSALHDHFADQINRGYGIRSGSYHDNIDTASLFNKQRGARQIAPLYYEELDVGEAQPKLCIKNAIWLVEYERAPLIILLSEQRGHFDESSKVIEITGPFGESTANYSNNLFSKIESCIKEASCYRGKVLSLERRNRYSGQSSGISVKPLSEISREQLVLPKDVLCLIERSVIEFTQQRELLAKYGQSTKRGVLLYGPPGTGKTHTIRYIASQLKEHTTLFVTAEQVALLDEYFVLAQLLQPSILVIEDADLIARDREAMGSACEEVLLNKLLNNMDGLTELSDVLFILTTNRPEAIEEALADRPGRIDQCIEIPKPDAECREKLLNLYAKELHMSKDLIDNIISKTQGVSASFIKELSRRVLQFALMRSGKNIIVEQDVSQALEDMLISGGKLNLSALGGGAEPM